MKISIKDITLIGMMIAVIEVCKAILGFLPNVELTTFWLIMFAICFGKRVLFAIPVFIIIEGAIYGFGLWWFMYLYIWPLVVIIALIFRKKDSVWFFSIVSGMFGLMFGLLCSFIYIFLGMTGEGVKSGINAGFAWWVAGIPWDIVHGVANFCIMLVLYKPIRNVLKKLP